MKERWFCIYDLFRFTPWLVYLVLRFVKKPQYKIGMRPWPSLIYDIRDAAEYTEWIKAGAPPHTKYDSGDWVCVDCGCINACICPPSVCECDEPESEDGNCRICGGLTY